MVSKIKLKPYTLVIRTTERCNVGCFHCSISATPKGNNISKELAKAAIKESKENGISRVHFTGGEPLLYENLADLIHFAGDLKMFTDITSSTFTKTGEDTINLLNDLKKSGLECVMLSYDEPHSRKVTIEQFTKFAKQSQNLGMHICVFVTEGGNTSFTTADLKREFAKEDIDVDKIEWSVSEYQFEGRGKKFIDLAETNDREHSENYCRCPYVMAVPTLNPDGNVSLCHMANFKTKNFTVGKYPDESFETILDKMEHSPIYRYLAKYGPQKSLRNIGFAKEEIPNDMCRACEKYLTVMETDEYRQKLDELFLNDNLEEIEVDMEAVLPIYQRYLENYGEKIIS